MKVIGITGGIGMGKSACSDQLVAAGCQVVDSDQISREITGSDNGVIEEIRERFGARVFFEDGTLDRSALAEVVFSNPDDRKALEMILHPRIRRAWNLKVRQWTDEGRHLGFVVIPLLYETQAESCFDAIVCVACTAGTQAKRLETRGWDHEQRSRRIASQMPVKEKMARSDYVVWTEGRMESTAEQLKMVLRRLG